MEHTTEQRLTRSTEHRTDHDLKDAVEQELGWVREVDAAQVGVAVHDGVVTLSGKVQSAAQRAAARDAVLSVRGVDAIANEIVVDLGGVICTDTDVADAVRHALRWNSSVPADALTVEVRAHVVTLRGSVPWDFQRRRAAELAEQVSGVMQVVNEIALDHRAPSADTAQAVRDAIRRRAAIDADSIRVESDGTRLTLHGTVSSWAERREAARAAWASPHVTDVVDEIQVVDR